MAFDNGDFVSSVNIRIDTGSLAKNFGRTFVAVMVIDSLTYLKSGFA